MKKLLLISVILASVALPWAAAADPSPVRGLRRAVLWVAAFDALYLLILLFIIPRLG